MHTVRESRTGIEYLLTFNEFEIFPWMSLHTENKLKNATTRCSSDSRQVDSPLSNNIAVYKRDGFLFFREDRTDVPETNIPAAKTTFVISSPVNDEVFSLDFLVDDEDVKMNFIKSFNPL